MSTYIVFKDGSVVHINDVFTGTETLYKCLETGHLYERERTAVKRAIMQYRKKLHNSTRQRRRRRRIVHKRRINAGIVRPSIVTYIEEGTQYHLVIDTGKRFKKISKAISNALRYAKRGQ